MLLSYMIMISVAIEAIMSAADDSQEYINMHWSFTEYRAGDGASGPSSRPDCQEDCIFHSQTVQKYGAIDVISSRLPNYSQQHRHVICRDCLAKQLLKQDFFDIRCTFCGQMISYRNTVLYIRSVILGSDADFDADDDTHKLVKTLIESLVGGLGPHVFIFSLNINNMADLTKFKKHYRRLSYLGEHKKEAEVLLESIDSIVSNFEIERKREKEGACAMHVVPSLYVKSLRFPALSITDPEFEYYVSLLKSTSVIDVRLSYCYAKFLSLLCNPSISIYNVTKFIIPIIAKTFERKKHPIQLYIKSYRCQFLEIENKSELALECIIETGYIPAKRVFSHLTTEYLYHESNTMTRRCMFIAKYADPCASLPRTDKRLYIFNRILADITNHFRPATFSFHDFLQIQDLARMYPGRKRDWDDLRYRYIVNMEAPVGVITGQLAQKFAEIGMQKALDVGRSESFHFASLEGVFVIFTHKMYAHLTTSIFSTIYSQLDDMDMKLFYLSELFESLDLGADSCAEDFLRNKGKKELHFSYFSTLVLYLAKKLADFTLNQVLGKHESEDGLRKIVIRHRRNLILFADRMKEYMKDSSTISKEDVLISYACICYYNSYIESHWAAPGCKPIKLPDLSNGEYELMFASLHERRELSTVHECSNVLEMVMSGLFSFFMSRDLADGDSDAHGTNPADEDRGGRRPSGNDASLNEREPASRVLNTSCLTYKIIKNFLGLNKKSRLHRAENNLRGIYLEYLGCNGQYYDPLMSAYLEHHFDLARDKMGKGIDNSKNGPDRSASQMKMLFSSFLSAYYRNAQAAERSCVNSANIPADSALNTQTNNALNTQTSSESSSLASNPQAEDDDVQIIEPNSDEQVSLKSLRKTLKTLLNIFAEAGCDQRDDPDYFYGKVYMFVRNELLERGLGLMREVYPKLDDVMLRLLTLETLLAG